MRLVVGCPVYRRAWSIPAWAAHVRAAAAQAPVEVVRFVFVHNGADDTETLDALLEVADIAETVIIPSPEPDHEPDHAWNDERHTAQAARRNQIRDYLRTEMADEYDAFLSLDSDVLLNPATLRGLCEILPDNGAAGGALFMHPTGTAYPSCGMMDFHEGRMVARPWRPGEAYEVDVLMACVMMTPYVVQKVPYAFHRQAEDVGWSINAALAEAPLMFDARFVSKHLMSPVDLCRTDRRVGW